MAKRYDERNIMKINSIYLGDCIYIMEKEIPESSIDLVYADPPYNLSGKKLTLINNKTGGPFYKMNEDWDKWEY
jgi:site-specific DNA-methyltransferase (adenine-specific)